MSRTVVLTAVLMIPRLWAYDTIDLVLLDGAKPLYPKVLSLIETHLRIGALIVADNADWCPDYLARVRSPAGGYLSVPFAADVELSMKLGPSN